MLYSFSLKDKSIKTRMETTHICVLMNILPSLKDKSIKTRMETEVEKTNTFDIEKSKRQIH